MERARISMKERSILQIRIRQLIVKVLCKLYRVRIAAAWLVDVLFVTICGTQIP